MSIELKDEWVEKAIDTIYRQDERVSWITMQAALLSILPLIEAEVRADIDEKVSPIIGRIKKQVEVSNSYSQLSNGDAETWQICNSHFKDMADELAQAIRGGGNE
jgi:hypothetical protein